MSTSIKLAFALLLFLALLSGASAQTLVRYTGNLNGTSNSPAIDTTSASLLVVECMNGTKNAAPTVSDSKSNTWQTLTTYGSSTNTGYITLSYAWGSGSGPIVGTNHTFTCNWSGGSGLYAAIYVSAWAGTQITADPLDGSTGAAVTSGTTGSPGPLTATTGDLAISGWLGAQMYEVTPTPSSGWTIPTDGTAGVYACTDDGGSAPDQCWVWQKASSGTIGITWTNTSDTQKAMNLAAFKALASTNYPRTPGDSATVSDALSAHAVLKKTATATDSAALSDTLVASLIHPGTSYSRSLADAASVSDSLQVSVSLNRTGELIGLSDSVSAVKSSGSSTGWRPMVWVIN